MRPGVRTTDHPRVGRRYRLFGQRGADSAGVCVSVTPWGNDQIRWIRLRLDSGAEKSFAPSHLRPDDDV